MKHMHSKNHSMYSLKRNISLSLVLLALLIGMTSCSSGGSNATSDTMPTVLNTAEYVLYQNIFYNDYGKDYVGKQATKNGIFTTLHDAWNGRTRYYVWGYNDNTKCCDWQWEIVPSNMDNLPTNGSQVTAVGTFNASDDALDGYWITDAKISVQTAYTGPGAEVDMAMMSDTLERVQVANIVRFPEQFEGMEFSAFGAIGALSTLDDPYYSNSWTIPYTTSQTIPAVGSSSLLRGTILSGELSNATFEVRAD